MSKLQGRVSSPVSLPKTAWKLAKPQGVLLAMLLRRQWQIAELPVDSGISLTFVY
jgi:hypothetical protein